MRLSCTLSTLKGIRVPQNYCWHGRVCPGILQHEDSACHLAWRFWGRKGGSEDQEKAAPLGLGRQLPPVARLGLDWHPREMTSLLWERAHSLSSVGGNSLPPPFEQGRANKSREPQQSGCYLGELSERSLPGHLCFSSA